MGRPPVAYGIWPDMITAAGSVAQLAHEIGCSLSWLRAVMTGRASFRGPMASTAAMFARRHGVTARVYSHPSNPSAYLISTASRWDLATIPGRALVVEASATRAPGEDWTVLPQLELSWGSVCVSTIDRQGFKPPHRRSG